jgi:hypothetical protein
MESKNDTLKQLEILYHQAATQPERSILLQTMRIVNPDECRRLEEIIQREQVRGMSFEEIATLIASQKGMTTNDARKAVADLIFDQIIDHSKLQVIEAAPSIPAPPVQPSRVAPPPAPRVIPRVPAVQILEPPKEPLQTPGSEERAPAERPPEPAAESEPAKSGGGFFMPRNIPQE